MDVLERVKAEDRFENERSTFHASGGRILQTARGRALLRGMIRPTDCGQEPSTGAAWPFDIQRSVADRFSTRLGRGEYRRIDQTPMVTGRGEKTSASRASLA